VKIKSAPGTDGTIVVSSIGVASAESEPANNTAAIVITTSGGSGGGLPVTGASAGIVAGAGAAVAALGVGLFMVARRRRLVLVAPND
jgi:LPXTG-motif cell wall-anchored protein